MALQNSTNHHISTMCGKLVAHLTILPILRSLGLFLKGLFGGLQNYEHTLANFKCYWINFNYCKWQNMEQPDSVTR